MTEHDRMFDDGAAANADMTAEEFAAATPSVPADRIQCTECSEEFIGNMDKSTICPTCRREMGIDQ